MPRAQPKPTVDPQTVKLSRRVKLRPDQDEDFIYIAPRHWAALLIRSVIPVLVGLGAIALFVFRSLSREPDFLGRQPALLDPLNIFLIVSVLVTLALVVYIYFDWANDHLIVSNRRIVHEDRTLWLAYNYEIIPLDQIQNVNKRVENIVQYVLNYGRIEIQASGPTTPIVFNRANCPDEVQKRVLDEVQRVRRSQERQRQAALIANRVSGTPVPQPVLGPPPRKMQTRQGPIQLLLPVAPQMQGGTITWHRHWVILLQQLVWPTISLVIWIGLVWALPRYDLLSPAVTGGVLIGLLVFVLGFFFWQYENWRNDVYVLEPTRIIDTQRLPFGLFEDRREATLGVIQNVIANSPNIFARIFGYGDVLVETAGAAGNFTFDHVPDPDDVQRIVFEYREAFKQRQRERDWANMLDIVEMYDQVQHQQRPPQP